MKSLHDQLADEIARLETRVSALKAALAALASPGTPTPAPKPVKTPAIAPSRRRRRAPSGHLEAQLERIIAAAGPSGLPVADIIQRLKAGGYEFSTDDVHIRKTLNKLPTIAMDNSTGINRYFPCKSTEPLQSQPR